MGLRWNEPYPVDGSFDRLTLQIDSRVNNQYLEVSRKLLKIERQTAIQLRNERRISDELLRELEHELDLE